MFVLFIGTKAHEMFYLPFNGIKHKNVYGHLKTENYINYFAFWRSIVETKDNSNSIFIDVLFIREKGNRYQTLVIKLIHIGFLFEYTNEPFRIAVLLFNEILAKRNTKTHRRNEQVTMPTISNRINYKYDFAYRSTNTQPLANLTTKIE